MKHRSKLACGVFCLALALAFPAMARAQIVFSDSFENDAGSNPPTTPYTGYNLPNPASTPPWNYNVDTGVVNTTPTDGEYNNPNGGIVVVTNTAQSAIVGVDGNYYMTIGNSGGSSSNDNPPSYSNRTPSAQTDTITTVTGTLAGEPGVFAANTTYTLSVLMAMNNGNTELTGMFSLLSVDGSNTTTSLNSFSLAATSAPDSNFNTYSLTFDTATNPSVVGDFIQIGLQASQTSNELFNPNVAYDNVVLTGVTDVPEPSSWVLMTVGLMAFAGLRIRSVSKRA